MSSGSRGLIEENPWIFCFLNHCIYRYLSWILLSQMINKSFDQIHESRLIVLINSRVARIIIRQSQYVFRPRVNDGLWIKSSCIDNDESILRALCANFHLDKDRSNYVRICLRFEKKKKTNYFISVQNLTCWLIIHNNSALTRVHIVFIHVFYLLIMNIVSTCCETLRSIPLMMIFLCFVQASLYLLWSLLYSLRPSIETIDFKVMSLANKNLL